MPTLYINHHTVRIPDHYREWDITTEADIGRRTHGLFARALDTQGRIHYVSCNVYQEEFHLIAPSQLPGYVDAVVGRLFHQIDDYSRDLALQGVTIAPLRSGAELGRQTFERAGRAFERAGRALGDLNDALRYHAMGIPPHTLGMDLAKEAPIPEPKSKRKRFEAKPPSEVAARLPVKAKPRKLRL
jgi:hypothetical protein